MKHNRFMCLVTTIVMAFTTCEIINIDLIQTTKALAVSDTVSIGSAKDLARFAARVNKGETELNASLSADIDLSSICNEVTNWTPIKGYNGVFDGNDHIISNLYYKGTTSDEAGLFTDLEGKVQNVKLSNIYIANCMTSGAICGINRGSIINCHVLSGKIIGSPNSGLGCGGICGVNKLSQLTDKYLSQTITPPVVENCMNNADIEVCVGAAGGICGKSSGGFAVTKTMRSQIKCCTNNGMISIGLKYKVPYIGGIVGSGSELIVSECYNTGKITGDRFNWNGGIIGFGELTEIKNCYNTGIVTTNDLEKPILLGDDGVGGIAGCVGDINISNCYNIGSISAYRWIGSIAGRNTTSSINNISNCYYLSGCSVDGVGVIQNGLGSEQAGKNVLDDYIGISPVDALELSQLSSSLNAHGNVWIDSTELGHPILKNNPEVRISETLSTTSTPITTTTSTTKPATTTTTAMTKPTTTITSTTPSTATSTKISSTTKPITISTTTTLTTTLSTTSSIIDPNDACRLYLETPRNAIHPGDKTSVLLEIDNNIGFAVFEIYIYLPPGVNPVLKDIGKPDAERRDASGELALTFWYYEDEHCIGISAMGQENSKTDGIIAVCALTVSSDCAAGNYPLKIQVDKFFDYKINSVPYITQDGVLVVQAKDTTTTTTTTTTATTVTTKSALKIEKTNITMTNGDQYTITANRNDVTYKSNNPDVAVVSSNGVITAVGVGQATITAFDSDSNVVQIKVEVTAITTTTTTQTTTMTTSTTPEPTSTTTTSTSTTTKPPTTSTTVTTGTTKPVLKLDKTSVIMTNGDQYTITANRSDITYKSNNPDVAVVSQKGIITAVGAGRAIISVIDSESNVVQVEVEVIPVETTTITTISSVMTTTTTADPYMPVIGPLTFNLHGDTAYVWSCSTDYQGDIEIPSQVGGKPVARIKRESFKNCKGITSIKIPDTVTELGYHAFEKCTGIKKVTLPNSLKSIGIGAFMDCSGLKSITIPDSVTEIESEAFRGCTELTNIAIPDYVLSIGNAAFYGCTCLSSVTIPDTVTHIEGSSFEGTAWISQMRELSPLVIVNDILIDGNAAMGDVSIPGNVKMIAVGAFKSCTNSICITIPDSITRIGERTFSGCSNLIGITMPNSVTDIDYAAFSDCTGLKSIVIPDSVTSIGELAFDGCTGLTSIVIPDSVTSIGRSAFAECSGLISITIPGSIKEIPENMFGCWSNKSNLKTVTISDGIEIIGRAAFNGCEMIERIIIPNSVTQIGECAFDRCLSLSNIVLSQNISEIEDATFRQCSNLKQISLPGKVTQIGSQSFYECSSLESISLPDGVTNIGAGAFDGCSNLQTVIVPKTVTSISDDAFRECSKLTIFGYADSDAEAYAKQHDIQFKSVENEAPVLGDINEDGEISVEDAQLTLNAYVKSMAGMDSDLTEQQVRAADVSHDGEVSVDDAQMILLYYVRNTLSGTPTTWEDLLGKNTMN